MTDWGPNSTPPPPGGPPQGPPQPYGSPGYPAPQYGTGYPGPGPTGTNGFSIASLICAFLCWPLGLIFGFVAKNQIKTTREGGDGLATAGIIISFIALALTVLYIVFAIAVFHSIGNRLNDFNNFNNFLPSPTP